MGLWAQDDSGEIRVLPLRQRPALVASLLGILPLQHLLLAFFLERFFANTLRLCRSGTIWHSSYGNPG